MRRFLLILALTTLGLGCATAQARDLSVSLFRSPSGGIHCRASGDALLCTVLTPRYSNGAFGTVDQRSASVGPVDEPGTGDPKTVLHYGQRWHRRGLSCTMRKSGITCRNRRGHGFFLSKATQRAF